MKADDTTLARLMAYAQGGDRRAYGELLAQCARWLERYFARRIAPCRLDDLVQDTLLSLHRKRSSYDPGRPFLPWLAAIARYRWVDHLRATYRRGAVALEEEVPAIDGEDGIVARISLDGLFALLTPAQARVIELVKIEGLSIAEAARSSGQSEPLVKVNIHRGLKKLAAMVETMESS